MIVASPPSALSGKRILVVEDEAILAEELVDSLEREGTTILGPTMSIEAALAFIASATAIDGALINVHLRGVLSLPVAHALEAKGIPFVFVTGNDEFVREHFPEVPVHPKPADMTKLVMALSALMTDRNDPLTAAPMADPRSPTDDP